MVTVPWTKFYSENDMPTPRQNREYLRDVVLPHLKDMWSAQAKRMLRIMGTEYDDPDDFLGMHQMRFQEGVLDDDVEAPAGLDFSMYQRIYKKNCNIITDQHNCGRTGCFAGWYAMMSDQQRRFIPWDPTWTSIMEDFDTKALARHFGIGHSQAHDLFASIGEGVEAASLDEYEGQNFDSGAEQCMAELTQGEVLDIRAEYLEEIME